MKYFGGCDVGSTYTKAVILDENGKMCADTTIRSKINAEQSAIAAMEEGERIARDPNAKSYTLDEALAEYNAKKTKTRDKIPDYYRHIEKSKQERLFHEVIFQIGNKDNCGCETPEGERAAAALKEFAEAFQERNPHLRVFNSVIHMDEATPHIHIDFVPVATEQKRGLAKRVSLKQALAQQGFTGQSKRQTEWNAWVNSEKLVLEQIAQQHSFEVIHGDGGRPHMSLPEYKEAARELEAARQEIEAARAEVSELQAEKETLQGTVKELKAAKKVSLDLERIKPEETMMGNIKGITLKEVKKIMIYNSYYE